MRQQSKENVSSDTNLSTVSVEVQNDNDVNDLQRPLFGFNYAVMLDSV